MKQATDESIEVVQIRDYLHYFYWGRHPQHKMMDMRLGGGSFAIHQGNKAIIIDTMTQPGQGRWVRDYLEATYHIEQFILISSHWHVDHVVDNAIYADSTIIGHQRTREVMLAKKAQFEAGQYSDYDPFFVVPPNLVFEGELTLWLGDLKIQLQTYQVHEEGHLGVLLPDEKIFIANDIVEDPIWFFDFEFAAPETQLAELERLLAQDIEVVLPCHASLKIMKQGGYTKALIQANINYLKQMLADLHTPDFATKSGPDYLTDELKKGTIHWWHPYDGVHEMNKATLRKSQFPSHDRKS